MLFLPHFLVFVIDLELSSPLGWRTTTEEQWHSMWPYMGPDVSAQCLSVCGIRWDLPQSTGAESLSTIHQRSWEPGEVPGAES